MPIVTVDLASMTYNHKAQKCYVAVIFFYGCTVSWKQDNVTMWLHFRLLFLIAVIRKILKWFPNRGLFLCFSSCFAVFSSQLLWECLKLWSQSSCCGSTWWRTASQPLLLASTPLTWTSCPAPHVPPKNLLSLAGSSADTLLLAVSHLKSCHSLALQYKTCDIEITLPVNW